MHPVTIDNLWSQTLRYVLPPVGENISVVIFFSVFGRESWSSGYVRRLMFQRSWIRIVVPYTGWTFFTCICYKNCIVCLKKNENKRKRSRIKKEMKSGQICNFWSVQTSAIAFGIMQHEGTDLSVKTFQAFERFDIINNRISRSANRVKRVIYVRTACTFLTCVNATSKIKLIFCSIAATARSVARAAKINDP